jgi:hypothetical protein
MMPESPKTCPLSTSVLQRWKSDGSGSFPVNDRNDDGSFPCYINAYSREDDAVLERWKSNGSFSFDDWNDDGSFPGNMNKYAREGNVITRKSISITPVLRKIRSLLWRRSQSLQSKKGRSLQPRRWRILCRSTYSSTSWDDGTTDLFADEEIPLLDWIEIRAGRWSDDWSCR